MSTLQMNGTAALPGTGVDSLRAQINAAHDNGKIDKAGRDFEAILLGSWLEQAEASFAKVPGSEEDEEDSGGEQFLQIAMQSLGTSLAASGGIGIAKMISGQLHRTAESDGTKSSVTTEPLAAAPARGSSPVSSEVP